MKFDQCIDEKEYATIVFREHLERKNDLTGENLLNDLLARFHEFYRNSHDDLRIPGAGKWSR